MKKLLLIIALCFNASFITAIDPVELTARTGLMCLGVVMFVAGTQQTEDACKLLHGNSLAKKLFKPHLSPERYTEYKKTINARSDALREKREDGLGIAATGLCAAALGGCV